MVVYLILASGNLAACLILVGWVKAVFPDDMLPLLEVLGIYLVLGPFPLLIPFKRRHPDPRPSQLMPVYLMALALLFVTAAFSLEFHRQLIELQLPLVVRDPVGLTLVFFAGYLPAALLLCLGLGRLTSRSTVAKPLLLSPGTGIPISTRSAQTQGKPAGVIAVEPTPKKEPENQLTLKASQAITEPMTAAEQGHEKNILSTKFSRLMTLFTLAADLKNDPTELIHTLVNSLGILFNLNSASVLLWDRDRQIFKTVATFGQASEPLRSYQTDAATGPIHTLIEQQRPVSIHETLEILRAGFPSGITSVYLFPLFISNQHVTSLLCIFDTDIDDETARIISAFCQQASLVQENAQLQRERRDLTKDVSVFLEIAKTVGSAMDSEEIFSIILDKSTQYVQAEQGSIMLLDEDRRELSIKAMKGLNKKVVELLKIHPGEGISGQVVMSGSPLIVADIDTDHRITQERRPRYKTKSFISIPLKLDGRTIGVLNVADKMSGEIFSKEDLQLLVSIGAYASVAIERSRFYQKTEELKKISITDSLTGLLNRRYFQERMSEEIERSRRHHLPLSLIMLDVDDFKRVNDSLGHLIGDEVLKATARCLRNSIRTIDVAARYGGEEFTVILPQTSKADAQTIAERICAEVYRLDLPFIKSDHKLVLSASLGLATYPEDAETLEDLIRNADIALYAAKSQGKNRVVVYGQ
ncbi:MAG TPA: diguanylate cyclase [Nitrospiria bacterium]|nr:diguanylate cyclase [Nitrospiria bacterium]